MSINQLALECLMELVATWPPPTFKITLVQDESYWERWWQSDECQNQLRTLSNSKTTQDWN